MASRSFDTDHDLTSLPTVPLTSVLPEAASREGILLSMKPSGTPRTDRLLPPAAGPAGSPLPAFEYSKPPRVFGDWAEKPVRATQNRVPFGLAPVDNITMKEATEWLLAALKGPRRRPLLVMGPNAYLVSVAQHDAAFARAIQSASLCLADGMSVVWGSRLLGNPIAERVPGGEFFEQMCARCAEAGLSVYFLGGMPGAADKAAAVLAERYPRLRVAGTDCPPMGFDEDDAELTSIRTKITAAKPDLLCVAFGAPRQEIWMMDHCPTLPIGAALSVGAAFDTQAGLRKRAPQWTHSIGAEWLYRLAMEPRRLWRRYLVGNTQFAGVLAREWVKVRKERAQRELLRPRA